MWALVGHLHVSTLRGEGKNEGHQVKEPFSHTIWVSGIEFRFSRKAGSVLNGRCVSANGHLGFILFQDVSLHSTFTLIL